MPDEAPDVYASLAVPLRTARNAPRASDSPWARTSLTATGRETSDDDNGLNLLGTTAP